LAKAAANVEASLTDDEAVPPWVQTQINQAALALGMAVSYMQRKKSEQGEP
jgi:hypothetical protein